MFSKSRSYDRGLDELRSDDRVLRLYRMLRVDDVAARVCRTGGRGGRKFVSEVID